LTFLMGGTLFLGFTAFYEPIIQEFMWSYTQVSIAFSIRGMEMGLLSPLAGFLVDRFGAKMLLLAGTFLVGSSFLFLSQVQSLWTFYGAFVFMAIGGSACSSTVLMAALAGWFRRNTGKAMGMVLSGFGAGGLAIAVIVYLIEICGWRNALIVMGVALLVLGMPLSFLVGKQPEKHQEPLPGEKDCLDPSRQPQENYWPGVPFALAIKNPDFWRIATAESVRTANTMAIVTHVMPYLASVGLSRTEAAWLATIIPVSSVGGRILFGWLCDKFDKRYVWLTAILFISVGDLLFNFAHLKEIALLFVIVYSTAFGGAVTLRGATLQEYFGAVSFGRLHGLMMGMSAIAGIVGVTGSAIVFDALQDYRYAWSFFAAANIFAAWSILKLKKSPQQTND